MFKEFSNFRQKTSATKCPKRRQRGVKTYLGNAQMNTCFLTGGLPLGKPHRNKISVHLCIAQIAIGPQLRFCFGGASLKYLGRGPCEEKHMSGRGEVGLRTNNCLLLVTSSWSLSWLRGHHRSVARPLWHLHILSFIPVLLPFSQEEGITSCRKSYSIITLFHVNASNKTFLFWFKPFNIFRI